MNGILDFIKNWIIQKLSAQDVKSTIRQGVLISSDMQHALETWNLLYRNKAPWFDGKIVKSLNLPAGIASEVARLVTIEMESQISGSPRAEYLNEVYQIVVESARHACEYAAAKGGLVFKPFFDGQYLSVEMVQAENFFPTQLDSYGNVIGGIFADTIQKGDNDYYTRLEHHIFRDTGIEIINKAYRSAVADSIGYEISLGSVAQWDMLEPSVMISNVNRPLFTYFRIPHANNIDTSSPLGVSIYSRVIGLLEQADRQYSRILWEYEGTELAIDADISLFKRTPDGKPIMPEGKERLFRSLDANSGDNKTFYNVFSPAIRDEPLVRGLNRLLMLIEDGVGISRGTFSDPESVVRTATELKIMKQRSYSTIRDIQKALENALEDTAEILGIYCDLYSLAPAGNYETSFKWDDSIITDQDSEYQKRLTLTDMGVMSKAELRAWYTGESLEDAEANLPAAIDMGATGI